LSLPSQCALLLPLLHPQATHSRASKVPFPTLLQEFSPLITLQSAAAAAAAAGNTRQNIQSSIPDRFPEVLTVTAMADQDGSPGGPAPWYCSPGDYTPSGNYTDATSDQYAWFSNFIAFGDTSVERHTVAAPGVCVRSTYPFNLDR
jgi:hypothetical protein